MIKKIEFRACISPIMSGIRTGNDGMRLSLDIPESDVPDAVALVALRNLALRITVEVDNEEFATKRKKKTKEKGEFGYYWQQMVGIEKFQNDPGLWEVLGVDSPAGVKDAMRIAFNVPSRSFISPEEFEQWCQKHNLTNLISQSRRAMIGIKTRSNGQES